jgi:signal peptidase I
MWPLTVGAAVVLLAGILMLRHVFIVVHVVGMSMCPSLQPGDRVIVRRGARGRLRAGDVVVLRAPFDVGPSRRGGGHWMIKRVSSLAGDPVPATVRDAAMGAVVVPGGTVVVLSDNPGGTDSRRWGFIALTDVLGPVILKVP